MPTPALTIMLTMFMMVLSIVEATDPNVRLFYSRQDECWVPSISTGQDNARLNC